MLPSAVMKKKTPCALKDLPPGCRARISKIEGTGDLRSRLSALGLTPDADIEVIDCACGRQVIKVRGCSLVLDGETACHVTCAPEATDAPQSGEEPCPGGRHLRKRRGLKGSRS